MAPLVKDERSELSVSRARLKESKLVGVKVRLESVAYLDDDGNDVVVDEEEEGDGGGEDKMSMRETSAK